MLLKMLLKRSLFFSASVRHHRDPIHSSSIHHNHRDHLFSSTSSTDVHPHQAKKKDEEKEEEGISPHQISTIFNIITSSSTPQSMSHSLTPHLSNPNPNHLSLLLDSVLKRARFSHSNPLRALHFFHLILSSKVNGSSFTTHPSPFAFNTMLYLLARSRRFQHSWDLLLSIRRTHPSLLSVRTLNVLLARVAKACSVRQTVHTFHRFKKLIHPFDTSCYNALLRTLAQEKTMADARNVYHSLKNQFRPDIQTFNILLSGWKAVEDAESFFQEMKDLKVTPDIVTYNCLIDVYCKNREVDKAYRLFDQMTEREIYPDVISYTSVIGGLGLIGQPDKARHVLKEMREAGCYPDAAAYNAAIRNYCIAKRMGDAFGLMDEMRSRGLGPNATSYNLFFRVYYWANDTASAWRLYRRMKAEQGGCLFPNVQSCMFLVRLCKRNEKVEMAMELWGDMVEKGFGALRLVSDVLFELLCDWGKLEEAEKCFVEMVEKGHRPSNVSFRRVKVLMELANRHESVRNLEEKMVAFGDYSIGIREDDDKQRCEKREVEMPGF